MMIRLQVTFFMLTLAFSLAINFDGKSQSISQGQGLDQFSNSRQLISSNLTESRIVGGFNATKGTYPFFSMALDPSNQFFCGGSLVTPEFILTAAHCLSNPRWNLSKFLVGALCPFQSLDNNCGQYYEIKNVAKVYKHPDFNPNTLVNDYALVRLSTRSKITPVTLDQRNNSASYTSGYSYLYTMGFGQTSSTDRNSIPSKLQAVQLGFIATDQCNKDYNGVITSSMLCASSPGRDACFGDSGGPLMDSNLNTQVGIVSFGNSCANSGYPGVYSRISDQWSWVRRTICDNHSSPKPNICRAPTLSPTKRPIASPVSPNPPPQSPIAPTRDCPSDRNRLMLRFKTDDNGSDTFYFLTKNSGGPTIALEGNSSSFQSNTVYARLICLSTARCYKFFMNSRSGKGMCCENGDGWYELSLNGKLIRRSSFMQGYQQITGPIC